jgi:hypothetical protein
MKENSGINMTNLKKDLNLEKFPALSDVILVEKILQDTNESIITKTKLEKLLHRKINMNILSMILNYLEEENRIVVTSRGITWIKSKKKDSKWNKILKKDEFLPLEKL